MNFKINLNITKKSKIIIATVIALALCGGTVIAYATTVNSSSAGDNQASTYKESPVTKGSLTAGTTETGTVALATESLYFGLQDVEVTTVNISEGQAVKQGDVLMALSPTAVASKRSELQLEYDKQANKLASLVAQNAVQKAKITSQYEQNLALETSAGADYNLALQKLANAVSQASTDQQKAEATASTAPTALANAIADTTAKKLAYDTANAAFAVADPLDPTYKDLETALQNTLKEYESAVKAQETAQITADSAPANLINANTKLAEAAHAESLGTASAKATYDEKIATFNNAKTIYTTAMAELDNNIKSQQTATDTAKSALATFDEATGDGTIVAPFDGLVKTVGYKVDDKTNMQTPALVLAKTDTSNVTVSITQDDVALLSVGQQSSVTLDAFEGEDFSGQISKIAVTPQREGSSTVSYTVTVELTDANGRLFDGMTGSVTFVTKQLKDVLYVSNKAVFSQGTRQYVKVKQADGTLKETDVVTGFSDGYNVEITSGVAEGDVVAIELTVQGGDTR